MNDKIIIKNAYIFDTEARSYKFGRIEADENGNIEAIIGYKSENYRENCENGEIDADGRYVVPGLVDIHTHGRAGADFAGASEDTLRMMRHAYNKTGVTTVVPTLASEPFEKWVKTTENVRKCGFDEIHYEGRYLNAKKRGAHAAELLKNPDASELKELLSLTGGMKVRFTLAPELKGADGFISEATDKGVIISIGHTDATYEEAQSALEKGATIFTHTYNAMSAMSHRQPGCVGAALTSDVYAEFICDGFHVHPAIVKLAYRTVPKDKFVLITDSLMAAGCSDGEYTLAGMKVNVTDGKAYTTDGAIAGSTLNLFDGVKNLCSFADASFEDAIVCATANAANAAGLGDRIGKLAVGMRADMLILSKDKASIEKVIVRGKEI